MEVSKRLANHGVDVRVLSTSTNHHMTNVYNRGRMTIEIFPAVTHFDQLFGYYVSFPLYKAIAREQCQILHAHGYQEFSLLASLMGKKISETICHCTQWMAANAVDPIDRSKGQRTANHTNCEQWDNAFSHFARSEGKREGDLAKNRRN